MLLLMLQGSESDGEERETHTKLQEGEIVSVGGQAPPTSGRVPAWHDEDDEEIRYIVCSYF